jgi:hypothetical protein
VRIDARVVIEVDDRWVAEQERRGRTVPQILEEVEEGLDSGIRSKEGVVKIQVAAIAAP